MNTRLKFINLLFGYKMTQCLFVAAKLNIADHLTAGSKTAKELALLVKAEPASLYRLLRCLAALGVFNESEDKTFSLNEASQLLLSNATNSLKDFVILCGDDLYKTTGDLLYTIETGLPAFNYIHGTDFWSYLDKNPDKAIIFHNAMATGSGQIINELTKIYNFSPYKKIIDVGGGEGHILCGILSANPNANGIVFDLSNAKQLAQTYINERNLADRCEFVTGNFFDSVPAGGDLYLLKVVLHDWNDEQAITILQNCRKAMSNHSKLLIIEKVIEENQFKDLACLGDINMLVTLTGKERNLEEFKNLLSKTGFCFERKIDLVNSFSIIESSPIN